MRLKSYYAASVAEAIENARVELGPEAMLLNSRETTPDQRHLGAYEVVFGLTGEPLLPRRSEAVAHLFAASKAPQFVPPAVEKRTFESQLAEVSAFASAAPRTVTPSPSPTTPPVRSVQEIPAWRRTLEELVSRQEAPVPVATLASSTAASASAPAAKAAVATPSAAVSHHTQPSVVPLSFPQSGLPARETPPRRPLSSTRSFVPPSVDAELPETPTPIARSPKPSPETLADELVTLRQQIERVRNSISLTTMQPVSVPATPSRPRDLDQLINQMTAMGFSLPFAEKMGDAALERLAAFSAESASLSYLNRSAYSLEHLQQVLVAELQSRFQVKPELGVADTGRRVVMLVGPPGAGKTTTLVKLAIKHGLERRVPVHMLSLDTVRVGGSEQLATFARILNVGFDALHTTTALAEALADCRTDQLVLVDCPGYAPADMEEASVTASFLRRNPTIDVHLVLPAVMNASSLQAAAQRFATFAPAKVLFTHLDEVDAVGPILEQTIKSGLPASFLTNGQGIPQDLQEATKDRFTQGILNGAAAFGAA